MEIFKREKIALDNRSDYLCRKHIIFVVGTLGSGKTTLIQNKFLNSEYIYINSDKSLEELYDSTYTLDQLYNQNRKIGTNLTDYALLKGYSMILEGTCQHEDVLQFIHKCKNYGYNIDVYIMDTDLDICLQRIVKRNQYTQRQIPDKIVKQVYNNLVEGNILNRLRTIVDNYKILSDNPYGSACVNTIEFNQNSIEVDSQMLNICESFN